MSQRASGRPILKDCWGYLDCRVVNVMDGGDMTCFLGEVLDGDTLSDSEPLWWCYARTSIPAPWFKEWDKITTEIEFSMKTKKDVDYTPWKPPGPAA